MLWGEIWTVTNFLDCFSLFIHQYLFFALYVSLFNFSYLIFNLYFFIYYCLLQIFLLELIAIKTLVYSQCHKIFVCYFQPNFQSFEIFVRLLIESGADISETTAQGTCLHLAALYGKVDVVKMLIEVNFMVILSSCMNVKFHCFVCSKHFNRILSVYT